MHTWRLFAVGAPVWRRQPRERRPAKLNPVEWPLAPFSSRETGDWCAHLHLLIEMCRSLQQPGEIRSRRNLLWLLTAPEQACASEALEAQYGAVSLQPAALAHAQYCHVVLLEKLGDALGTSLPLMGGVWVGIEIVWVDLEGK